MSRSTRSPFHKPFRNSLVLATLMSPAAHAQAPGPDRSCLDVQVGSARSFDCITRGLRAQVQSVHPPQDDTIVTATSPANRVGTFNQSATREYLGSSFGHSAVPQAHPQTTAAPPP